MAQEEVVTVKQYFDSLRGEQRTQELLRLADGLLKAMADGKAFDRISGRIDGTGHDAPEGSARRRQDVTGDCNVDRSPTPAHAQGAVALCLQRGGEVLISPHFAIHWSGRAVCCAEPTGG